MIKNIEIALAIIAVIWAVFLIDFLLPPDLRFFGIKPRNLDGLPGIICAPFLHGDFTHLTSNSGALFVLLFVSLSLDRKLTAVALFSIIILGGSLVWLFGRSHTVHIGASGVIFGMIGFLMFIGIFRKEWKPLVVSLIVFFLYGSLLLSLFKLKAGVSWSGHFFGFASGIVTAWVFRSKKQTVIDQNEETEFLN